MPREVHKGHIVFSGDVVPWFSKFNLGPIHRVKLKDHGVQIRNYEEIDAIYTVRVVDIESEINDLSDRLPEAKAS